MKRITNKMTYGETTEQQTDNKQITTNKNDKNIFIYFINKYKSNDKNFGDYMKRNKEMREDEKWELLTSEEQMKLTGMI